jgi:hypothetical protein
MLLYKKNTKEQLIIIKYIMGYIILQHDFFVFHLKNPGVKR